MKGRFYQFIRDLHLYFGLFLSPFLLVFALSTMVLNHRLEPDPEVSRSTSSVEFDGDAKPLEQARQVIAQLGMTGEVKGARHVAAQNALLFRVSKPGEETRVRVDLDSQEAAVERREGGLWDAMIYLHITPGAHSSQTRINWIYSKIWSRLTDTVVYLLLFLTFSGIYMWAVLKAERKVGLVFLGLGAVSLVLVLVGFLSGGSSA